MKKKPIIFSLIIPLLFLLACEKTEKLEDFPLYPPKLVLNSYLNADSTISIQLSKSLSVLDNADLKHVGDGSMKLYENGNLIGTIISGNGDWNYKFNNKAIVGATYNVEAETPSLGKVSASTIIPSKVSIKKFEAEALNVNSWEHPYKFSITIDDPPGEKNYYMIGVELYQIHIHINGTDTLINIDYPSKAFLNSSSNPAIDQVVNGNAFFKDDFFNGKNYTIDVNTDYLNTYADKIKIIITLYSLTEECYKYRLSYGKYKESSDNPFAEPVQVFNNIKGGYGIFAGEAIAIDSLTFKGDTF